MPTESYNNFVIFFLKKCQCKGTAGQKFSQFFGSPSVDIYFKVVTTMNYDNQPTEGASELDYIFQTTVGWKL